LVFCGNGSENDEGAVVDTDADAGGSNGWVINIAFSDNWGIFL